MAFAKATPPLTALRATAEPSVGIRIFLNIARPSVRSIPWFDVSEPRDEPSGEDPGRQRQQPAKHQCGQYQRKGGTPAGDGCLQAHEQILDRAQVEVDSHV